MRLKIKWWNVEAEQVRVEVKVPIQNGKVLQVCDMVVTSLYTSYML